MGRDRLRRDHRAGGRAGYYDHAGALRDMVQNHLLRLLCLVAMEPPTRLDPRHLHHRKVELLRTILPPSPGEMATRTVRARYTTGRSTASTCLPTPRSRV